MRCMLMAASWALQQAGRRAGRRRVAKMSALLGTLPGRLLPALPAGEQQQRPRAHKQLRCPPWLTFFEPPGLTLLLQELTQAKKIGSPGALIRLSEAWSRSEQTQTASTGAGEQPEGRRG